MSLPLGQTTVQLTTEDGNKIFMPLVLCHTCSSSQGKDVPMVKNTAKSQTIGTDIAYAWECPTCGDGGFVLDVRMAKDGKSRDVTIL